MKSFAKGTRKRLARGAKFATGGKRKSSDAPTNENLHSSEVFGRMGTMDSAGTRQGHSERSSPNPSRMGSGIGDEEIPMGGGSHGRLAGMHRHATSGSLTTETFRAYSPRHPSEFGGAQANGPRSRGPDPFFDPRARQQHHRGDSVSSGGLSDGGGGTPQHQPQQQHQQQQQQSGGQPPFIGRPQRAISRGHLSKSRSTAQSTADSYPPGGGGGEYGEDWRAKYFALKEDYDALYHEYNSLLPQVSAAKRLELELRDREAAIRSLEAEVGQLRGALSRGGGDGKGISADTEKKILEQNEEIQKLLEQRIALEAELAELRFGGGGGGGGKGAADDGGGGSQLVGGSIEQERLINNLKAQLKERDDDIDELQGELNAAKGELARVGNVMGLVATQVEKDEKKKKRTWWGGSKRKKLDPSKLTASELADVARDASGLASEHTSPPSGSQSPREGPQVSPRPGEPTGLTLQVPSAAPSPSHKRRGSAPPEHSPGITKKLDVLGKGPGGGGAAHQPQLPADVVIVNRRMLDLERENARLEGEVAILEKERVALLEKQGRLESQLDVLRKSKTLDEANMQAIALAKNLAFPLPREGGSEADQLRALTQLQQAALQKVATKNAQLKELIDQYNSTHDTAEQRVMQAQQEAKTRVSELGVELTDVKHEKVNLQKELEITQTKLSATQLELERTREALVSLQKVHCDAASRFNEKYRDYNTIIAEILKDNEALQNEKAKSYQTNAADAKLYHQELEALRKGEGQYKGLKAHPIEDTRTSRRSSEDRVTPTLRTGNPPPAPRRRSSDSIARFQLSEQPHKPLEGDKVGLRGRATSDVSIPQGDEADAFSDSDNMRVPLPQRTPQQAPPKPMAQGTPMQYRWTEEGYALRPLTPPPQAKPSYDRTSPPSSIGPRPVVTVDRPFGPFPAASMEDFGHENQRRASSDPLAGGGPQSCEVMQDRYRATSEDQRYAHEALLAWIRNPPSPRSGEDRESKGGGQSRKASQVTLPATTSPHRSRRSSSTGFHTIQNDNSYEERMRELGRRPMVPVPTYSDDALNLHPKGRAPTRSTLPRIPAEASIFAFDQTPPAPPRGPSPQAPQHSTFSSRQPSDASMMTRSATPAPLPQIRTVPPSSPPPVSGLSNDRLPPQGRAAEPLSPRSVSERSASPWSSFPVPSNASRPVEKATRPQPSPTSPAPPPASIPARSPPTPAAVTPAPKATPIPAKSPSIATNGEAVEMPSLTDSDFELFRLPGPRGRMGGGGSSRPPSLGAPSEDRRPSSDEAPIGQSKPGSRAGVRRAEDSLESVFAMSEGGFRGGGGGGDRKGNLDSIGRDNNTMESTKRRVTIWSSMKLCVLLGLIVLQINYLRSFFEFKSIV